MSGECHQHTVKLETLCYKQAPLEYQSGDEPGTPVVQCKAQRAEETRGSPARVPLNIGKGGEKA